MMTLQTFFVDGVAVGKIGIETQTQEIAFIPKIFPSKLPIQDYESLDELTNAVTIAYQKKGAGTAT